MNKIWKIGIVHDTAAKGRGGHGLHLAFHNLPNVEITALADANPDGWPAVGAQRNYATYQEMIEQEKLDIVVLWSRLPGDHIEPVKMAAEKGIHVLCEKPLTASLHEADEMIRLAEEKQIKIGVAHLGRYALVFQTLKKMIENGDIGRPLTFYGRGKEDDRGGGEDMTVLGTHILDQGRYFFGTPEYVFANVMANGCPVTAADRSETTESVGAVAGDEIMAYFKFPGGVNGIFESRKKLSSRGVRMGVTIAGTTGSLSMRYDEDRKLRLSRSPFPPEDEAVFEEVPLYEERVIPEAGEVIFENQSGPARYFGINNRFAAWDLMRAIEKDRQPLSSIYDARAVLEMIYGVYASHLSGQAMHLPLENRNHPLGS